MNDQSSLPTIDFGRIRIHGSSQNKGFEELSVQLFRETRQNVVAFYRVDDRGGDGGLECYVTLTDGRKVGMQAKYVFSASAKSSLWQQLNKSVTTALQTHCPDLCEYHVYVPCDRDKDAKIWNNHVKKWRDEAKQVGYLHDIDFIWHGASELLSDLMREQNRPLLHYWFGARLFSTDWIKQQFDASRKLIDSRYNRRPEGAVEDGREAAAQAEGPREQRCGPRL